MREIDAVQNIRFQTKKLPLHGHDNEQHPIHIYLFKFDLRCIEFNFYPNFLLVHSVIAILED